MHQRRAGPRIRRRLSNTDRGTTVSDLVLLCQRSRAAKSITVTQSTAQSVAVSVTHMRRTTSAPAHDLRQRIRCGLRRRTRPPCEGQAVPYLRRVRTGQSRALPSRATWNEQARPTSMMFNNCAARFAATMPILEPTVDLQGSLVAKSVAPGSAARTHLQRGAAETHLGKLRMLVCSSSIPLPMVHCAGAISRDPIRAGSGGINPAQNVTWPGLRGLVHPSLRPNGRIRPDSEVARYSFTAHFQVLISGASDQTVSRHSDASARWIVDPGSWSTGHGQESWNPGAYSNVSSACAQVEYSPSP